MKTLEQHRAYLDALYGRPFSPDEAAEVLEELESYVAVHKRELKETTQPASRLSRAAWVMQGAAARHQAYLRMAVHDLFNVPLSEAHEVLQAIETLSLSSIEAHGQRPDLARLFAGNPRADQPFEKASAKRALSVIRRLSRNEARSVIAEINRRARLFPSDGGWVGTDIFKQALNATGLDCVHIDAALRERAGVLSHVTHVYVPAFTFRQLLGDVSVQHARKLLDGDDFYMAAGPLTRLTETERNILRRVAQRDVEAEARYDTMHPEDAWRELADLTRLDLADRFSEMDSAEAPSWAWRNGSDAASVQLAQAVARLPATAHIRGLQRAAGLARFACPDLVAHLGLRDDMGPAQVLDAIDELSQADARSLLHDLAAYYQPGERANAWDILLLAASRLDIRLFDFGRANIYEPLARRAGVPQIDVGQPASYQALRELPAKLAQDLLDLSDTGIFEAPDAETIQALHDAASPRPLVPSLQDLALEALRGRGAWEALARDVGRADLIERDDRAAHEEVVLQVIQNPEHYREELAHAAGLGHLFYSHAIRERAKRAQREVPPEVAAWRELTAQLGLPEYRLSHAEPNAQRAVAVASLRCGHTVDELVHGAGLSRLRDEALREQRTAFFERKQTAGSQREHEGHSL